MNGQNTSLVINSISKSFGGLKVFHDLSFTLNPGEVLGVIGPNGAGKTTMINIISGRLMPTAGEVWLGKQRIDGAPVYLNSQRGLVRSFQQTAILADTSVRDNLVSAIRFSGNNGEVWDLIAPLLDEFGLSGEFDRNANVLPYGLQKMLGLTMTLATRPRMLLLDEPAAGLEKSERPRIDRFLGFARDVFGCGALIVEHDMDLIKRLCPRVIVLDGGRLIAEGDPDSVLSRKDVIDAYLGGSEEEGA